VTDQGIGSLTFYHDAGFILGIGQSSVTGLVPQRSQGPNVGSPGITPFLGFPVMAADNENTGGPSSQTVTVYFPAAGIYPFELDYFQANSSLTLNLTTSFSLATPTPLPTFTYTPSNTSLPTLTPTFTPTFTYTPSITPLPTATPTFTPTFTYTPSITPLPTVTPTFTPTFTYTPSITPPPTATATFTASITLTPTITLTSSKTNTALFKCQSTPTPNAGSPTSTPIPCNTVTPSPTLTPSFTKTPSLTMTPSITRTPSITPLSTATSTKTLTATPNLPPGVTCIDWHLGAQGWVSSPWMASGVSVQWDTNGLHGSAATNLGTKTAGAYFQLPPGGPYKVAFSTNSQSSYTVAQGSVAPSTLPLTQVITAQNSVYLATQPFIELQWSIQTPVVVASTLQFYSFCYISTNPTATVTYTPTPTLSPTPLASITQTPTPSKTPIYQANGLNVYVAYADDQHATSPNFPVPWFDSPNVIFKGYIPPTTPWVGKYDSGAIRIENPTSKTVTVHNITVSFPNHPNMFNQPPAPDYSFSLPSWGVDTDIPPGQSLILTETLDANPVTNTQFTFDTSDNGGIAGATYIDCQKQIFARPDDSPPRVVITMKDGTFSTLYDSAHILDTGGIDIGASSCGAQNEGKQWQAIGVVGGSGTYLILNTSNSSPVIGTPITLTAHLTDASGSLPASGVPVMFYITGGGPNQGAIYNSTTNAQGYALYTYSSASYGPDTITARITNVTGSVLSSNAVTVNWMYPITPTVTPTPRATNTPAMTPTNLPPPPVIVVPGCITSPITPANNLTQINQPIDIKINTTLTNASVDYWPVDNPGLDVVLKTSFLASPGAILTSFDPTTVADGSYAIRVQGTDPTNTLRQCGTIVSVVGNYKPGRVKFTINDFTLPVAGLPITISRTYDSLQRNRVGDFGFGWSLAISSPQITVDPAHNVTITLADGSRKTFYFTPQFGYIFSGSKYQAEAGTHGQLSSNCFYIALSGGQYFCTDTGSLYQPTAYTYTDAYGRVFVYSFSIDATGTQRSALTSMTDVQGNKLVYAPNGITYTNARSGAQLGITWIRDNLGRIAQITTPADGLGNTYTYLYTYDSVTGDLASVTYPPVGNATPILKYVYYANDVSCSVCAHLFNYALDPQNHGQIIVDNYYLQADGILQGRLKSESRSLTGADDSTLYPPPSLLTYGYAYPNLTDPTNYPNPTTKVTNPDGGQVTITYDTYGMVLHKVETVNSGHARGVTYTYYDTTDPSKTHLLNTEIVDGMASGKSYGYDANGFQNFVKDENGYVTSSIYNKYGGMSSKTDPERYTTGVTYGSGFDTYLPKAVSASKDATSLPYGGYDWNTDGTIAVRRDGAGNQTTYSYDQYGNLASEKDPGYQATNYQYDNLGRLQTAQTSIPVGMSAPAGRTDYTHDGMGHVTSVTTHPDANTAYTYAYGYDLNGNKTDEWDPRSTGAHSYHTQYVYDAANHLWKVIYPNSDGSDGTSDSNKVTYSYDWRGQRTRFVDQASNLTCYQYDQVGRLTMTTYGLIYGNTCPSVSVATPTPTATPTGVIGPVASVTYTYDDANRKTSETDGRGYTTTYGYDLNGNLLSVNHPVASNPTQTYAFESYGYYQNGWRKSATDAGKLGGDSMTTLYTYNPRGQVVLTQYGGNSNEQRCYDNSGNSTQVIDQNGESTYYQYQNGSQLVSVIKPFVKPASQCNSPIPTPNQTTGYQYDTQGNLQVITDGNGHQTSFNYDALGRQIQKTWPAPSGNSTIAYETFGYDAVGNMTSHQLSDDKSHINTYQFDALNRETHIGYFDGHSADFDYTGTSKRWHVSIDNTPYETYSYDSRDRLTLIQHANVQQAVSYAYDQNNNRTQLTVGTYGSTNTTNYAYDPDNRLKNVTNPTLLGASATISYDYYLNNLRQDLKYPNGVTTNYTYDAYNHLNVINQANSAGLIANYQYTLDTVGNRASVAENNGSTTTTINWCYDAAMRLTGEGRNIGCQSGSFVPTSGVTKTNYVYDSVGNRLSQTTDNQPTNYNYNSLDQLTNDGSSTYTYDGRGNQQTVTGAGITTTYGWNAADQLNSLTKTSTPALSASYAYDADGRRRQQNINVTTTNYLWDEASQYGDVVAETDGGNVLKAQYLRNNQGGLLAQNRSSAVSYYLRDGQGNVRALADTTGLPTDRYAYNAFGNSQQRTGTNANPYQYTGEQLDAATGLYNLRARYYDVINASFLTRDTLGLTINNPLQLNRYLYSQDNPINLSDPTGYQSFAEYDINQSSDSGVDVASEQLSESTQESIAQVEEGSDPELCTYSNSFNAETLVTTDKGSQQISELKIGDHVLAYNQDTGKNGYYPITAVMVHADPITESLIIDGDQIETTPGHLFYTNEKGWVKAGDLKLGEHIRKSDNSYGIVQHLTLHRSLQKMYDLSIGTARTFFVGSQQFLVHNVGTQCYSNIDNDRRLVKEAQVAGKNEQTQASINGLKDQIRADEIYDEKNIEGNLFEARDTYDAARVYFRRLPDGVREIVGVSNKANQAKVIRILLEVYFGN